MTSNPQAVETLSKWLGEYKRTSLTRRHAQLGEMRFQIVRSFLAVEKVTKFADLDEERQLTFCYALGLTVPGPTVKMDWNEPKPYTPGPRQAKAEYPKPIQPEGSTVAERMEAKRQEMRALRIARYAAEEQADKEGDLWTVAAAYHPDSIFLVIKQGRHGDDWFEVLRSQHESAHMFLEPQTMMGKIGPVRAEAVRTHTGKHTGDVTVRIIERKSA